MTDVATNLPLPSSLGITFDSKRFLASWFKAIESDTAKKRR